MLKVIGMLLVQVNSTELGVIFLYDFPFPKCLNTAQLYTTFITSTMPLLNCSSQKQVNLES